MSMDWADDDDRGHVERARPDPRPTLSGPDGTRPAGEGSTGPAPAYDSHREALASIAPEHRRAAEIEKSDRLFRLACETQDALEEVGIYYGDGKLLDAKVKIHEACEKARAVCGKVRYGGAKR